MDPLMDSDVLVQYLAVDDERRHLVLRVYLQVLGREILPLTGKLSVRTSKSAPASVSVT